MSRSLLKYEVWMDIAEDVSRLSTCQFTQVGAILLTKEMKIISTGYNGTASGSVHCCDLKMDRDEHKEFADTREIHAEMNALIQANDASFKLKDSICFSTLQPCLNCVKHLYQAGVRKFIYKDEYWRIDQDQYKKDLSCFIGIEVSSLKDILEEGNETITFRVWPLINKID